jgi:hypothetical protein
MLLCAGGKLFGTTHLSINKDNLFVLFVMLRSSKPWCVLCALDTVREPKDALRWFPNVRLTMWELLNFIENSRSSKSFFREKMVLVFIIVGKLSMSKIS